MQPSPPPRRWQPAPRKLPPPDFENDKVAPFAEGSRVIAVSFGRQTKTYLDDDGLQPKFNDGDSVLISNGKAVDTCKVKVEGDAATITTNLTGPLTAVYPYTAAGLNGNTIDTVLVSTVQSGKFADANICMAKMKDEKDESLSFENKTAVFRITPGSGASTKYVEVITAGPEIANTTTTEYTKKNKIHVATTVADEVFVSVLVPDGGLKLRDLSFADGSNMKTVINTTAIAANTIYTIKGDSGWDRPYVEIEMTVNSVTRKYKWATQNLSVSASGKTQWKSVCLPGTTTPVQIGDYFQWAASYGGYNVTENQKLDSLLIYTAFTNMDCGDSEGKFTFIGSKQFDKANAPYGGTTYTKYTSNSEPTLELSDDVANIILGGNWRMPTSAEFQAMKGATYWAWDATDCGYYVFMPGLGTSGAANGREIFNTSTDDKSKALLFFPAAGFGNVTDLYSAGALGFYWSSSLYSGVTDRACNLTFNSDRVSPQDSRYGRFDGFSVRPVSD